MQVKASPSANSASPSNPARSSSRADWISRLAACVHSSAPPLRNSCACILSDRPAAAADAKPGRFASSGRKSVPDFASATHASCQIPCNRRFRASARAFPSEHPTLSANESRRIPRHCSTLNPLSYPIIQRAPAQHPQASSPETAPHSIASALHLRPTHLHTSAPTVPASPESAD